MLNCFINEKKGAIPITLVPEQDFLSWLDSQKEYIRSWLTATQFLGKAKEVRVIPSADGGIEKVICCITNQKSLWGVGHLPFSLPEGRYFLDLDHESYCDEASYAISWGLGAYQFRQYKKTEREPAQLYLPEKDEIATKHLIESLYLVRDLINTPTEDMGPSEFAKATENLAKELKANYKEIVGEELLRQNYPAIYTVGRASDDPPRLLELRWGTKAAPKVTLVGKGVCFDSGGLDIKSSAHMALMKKDMAGAAHVLGLARMIILANLPIHLRVLMPVVENVISGNAYRPGDVIKSRQGLTIEIGNTDAEGRVILADALCEAASEGPELIIDMSTLTGAARVALGTELPAVFCNNEEVIQSLLHFADQQEDPMWRLPLFSYYREYLNSSIADINNNSTEPYGGAITAALFLNEFVPAHIPWLHFDIMAWNIRSRPGKPQGGEAMALRALFQYLHSKYR